MRNILNEKQLSVRDNYLIRSHTASMLHVITDWLNNGCIETPQYITELIIEIMPERLRKYFAPTYPDFSGIHLELFDQ